MRFLTSIAVSLASAGLVMAAGSPAQAVSVRPSTAPLTNAGGVANGCTASVSVTAGRAADDQPVSIIANPTLTCDAAADVHWHAFRSSLFEVMPDGSLRTIYPMSLIARASTVDALVGTTDAATYSPCNTIAGRGKHTWLVRAVVRTKHARVDPAPFVARVDALKTITCR